VSAERDWEAAAARRLDRNVEGLVSRMRATADQIEREAKHNIAAATKGDRSYATYARVAGQAIHELHALVFNANAADITDAAHDADRAHQEKQAAGKGSTSYAAKVAALTAVLVSLDGWIEGAQENHEAMGHRHENRGEECWRSYAPGDIRNMVNDAAREVGVSEIPMPSARKEDLK